MADSVNEVMREEEVAKLDDDIVDVSEIISLRIFDVILIFVLCLQELWPIPGTSDAVDIKNDILIYSFKYEYVIKEVNLEDVFDLKWILPILAIHKGDWDAVIALYEH